jgi:hypothetical protein
MNNNTLNTPNVNNTACDAIPLYFNSYMVVIYPNVTPSNIAYTGARYGDCLGTKTTTMAITKANIAETITNVNDKFNRTELANPVNNRANKINVLFTTPWNEIVSLSDDDTNLSLLKIGFFMILVFWFLFWIQI